MDFAFDAATIEAAIKRYNATRGTYAVYRAYARGEQELKYLDADLLRESGKEMRGLRENLCAAAISASPSPMPKPISRMRGAVRPNTASRSSAAAW